MRRQASEARRARFQSAVGRAGGEKRLAEKKAASRLSKASARTCQSQTPSPSPRLGGQAKQGARSLLRSTAVTVVATRRRIAIGPTYQIQPSPREARAARRINQSINQAGGRAGGRAAACNANHEPPAHLIELGGEPGAPAPGRCARSNSQESGLLGRLCSPGASADKTNTGARSATSSS